MTSICPTRATKSTLALTRTPTTTLASLRPLATSNGSVSRAFGFLSLVLIFFSSNTAVSSNVMVSEVEVWYRNN
jgi:hypothetical protein